MAQLCGRRADVEGMDLGDPRLEREVSYEVGRVEERERIRTIVEHGQACARPLSALALALETDIPAKAAADLLAKLPAESARANVRGRS